MKPGSKLVWGAAAVFCGIVAAGCDKGSETKGPADTKGPSEVKGPAAAKGPGDAKGRATVKVNGKELPESRIEAQLKNYIAQGRPDSPELRNLAREEAINREIIIQEAQKGGLEKRPEIAARIDQARQEILLGAYLMDHVKANPITEDAMKKEYERVVQAKGSAREYKAHHILVEKEDEAKALIAQIKKGAKFEKLAAERSRDQGSKGNGGELGWSPAERYVKPFGDALAGLKKGQTTDTPVQTQFGWHIIRLDDERAPKVPGYDEVKPQLQQMMQNQSIQKLVADMRAKAKVE
jgi:peptidyl-prolyl cis-trans isomerase C